MARTEETHSERSSICFGLPNPNDVALPGEARFSDVLFSHYEPAEALAQEQAILLKQRAKDASQEDFWQIICAGLADIFGAQLSFISTRVTHDRITGRALPPMGEKGSYLNALGLYFNDPTKSVHGFEREVLYKSWDCPCSGMKYGKVFIIPSQADKFNPANPNASFLPFELEAYIGVPCLTTGVNVGHFGILWNKTGSMQRRFSWSFTEAILHSFEDLVLSRIMRHIEKDSLTHYRSLPADAAPDDSVPALNSFKPHAHVLSHELRTPMQGVVGMLDLVQATVQDAISSTRQISLDGILNSLKDDITAIQDSSKRAVEATENIIEAYKLDMGIRLKNTLTDREPAVQIPTRIHAGPLARRLSGSSENPRGVKRKHTEAEFHDPVVNEPPATDGDRRVEPGHAVTQINKSTTDRLTGVNNPSTEIASDSLRQQSNEALDLSNSSNNGLQDSKISELIDYIVNESFNAGSRPDSVSYEDTATGRIVHARYRQENGETHYKMIRWDVGDDVPETIQVHERDLAKLVSCVFQNAVKFTSTANIDLRVYLDPADRMVVINVCDNGPGIHPEFRPRMFQPFTKADNSITRRTEGLGLGLLVAKGLAGKLGGDLNLVRSETEGEEHGTEFEIRFPMTPTGMQTPRSHASAPPTVIDAGSVARRRQSSASSHLLRMGNHPAPPGHEPFGKLPKELFTPLPSNQVSPKLSSIPEAPQSDSHVLAHEQRDGDSPASLTFLVVEDNHINRKLLVNMLIKLGHDRRRIFEAYDGADAVRQVTELHARHAEEVRLHGASKTKPIDLVLMDIWMPNVDGYEATERILALYGPVRRGMRRCISEPGAVPVITGGNRGEEVSDGTANFMIPPTILAVTADATDDASARAAQVGMEGFIAKPFKLKDLDKLVKEAEKKRHQHKDEQAA